MFLSQIDRPSGFLKFPVYLQGFFEVFQSSLPIMTRLSQVTETEIIVQIDIVGIFVNLLFQEFSQIYITPDTPYLGACLLAKRRYLGL